MWRKDHRRLLMVIAFGLVGCADAGRVALPTPTPSDSRSPGAPQHVPTYNTADDIPLEYQRADIKIARSTVEWIDRTAYADAYTKYYGNRAQHQMKLTILSGYSSVATQDQTFLASSYWPSEQDYNSDLRFTAAESCGQSANLNTTHSAWFETFVVSGNMVVYRANGVSTQASAAQPACTRDEDVAEPVGGGCAGGISCQDEAPAGYSWCVVRYSYDRDTGEILDWRILYCY